jgi:hypothetical protein
MEKTALRWLRVSYWIGAFVDFAAGWMMLVPALFRFMNQPQVFQPANEYRYAMGMGAPLMFGWTVLLLWADRKPFERKGILPITLLVVFGEIAAQVWGISIGFIPLAAMIPTFVMQAMLVFLFGFAYFGAGRVP